MLPGTYEFTHPLEIAHVVLPKRWNDFSKQLAKAEARYRDMGMSFHRLPTRTNETPECTEAFIIPAAQDGAPIRFPALLVKLDFMREYRDAAKRFMRCGDIKPAQQNLDAAEPMLEEVEIALDEISHHVRDLERSTIHREEAPEERENRLTHLRNFIISLPENLRAEELGLMVSEGSLMAQAIEGTEERLVPETRRNVRFAEIPDFQAIFGVGAPSPFPTPPPSTVGAEDDGYFGDYGDE